MASSQRRPCEPRRQLKVMSAIESCRIGSPRRACLARCEDCVYTTIACNSCRNRHRPKCRGAAARTWLAEREAELLPVPYFHVVFTLPAAHRRHRLPEQGGDLRSPVQGLGRHADHDCAPNPSISAPASVSPPCCTPGVRRMDSPSARAHDRAGRRCRSGARWVSSAGPIRRLLAAHEAGRLQFFGNHSARRCTAFATIWPLTGRSRLLNAVRRPRGSAGLSLALYPSRRHLQQPLDRIRPARRHLQVEGLPDRRPRSIQADDAHNRRVHPPILRSTSCRRDSTASATTACAPRRPAPTTSRAPANCSPGQSPKANPPMLRITTSRHVHVAAAA